MYIEPCCERSEPLEQQYTKVNNNMSDGTNRNNIEVGLEVDIVQKHHQRSGELTRGVVQKILTKSSNHTHGIKVSLESGEVGRVKNIIED